jgi:hypothetical protein
MVGQQEYFNLEVFRHNSLFLDFGHLMFDGVKKNYLETEIGS